MNEILSAVITAVIEGLTEFIPVSSTGHMILFGELINFNSKSADTFKIFIQLGAILAITLIYKEKFLALIPSKNASLKEVFVGKKTPNVLHFTLAVFPALLAGFFLYKTIKTQLFSPTVVAIGLIVGGVIMIIVDRAVKKFEVKTVEEITHKQAFIIGLGQCFALWPGMSRSGSTMVTSLLLGIKHKAAADFSFIIAVPVMVAAVGYDMLKSYKSLSSGDLVYFGIGFVVAFLVSWVSVKWFLKVLTQIKLAPFGIYRIIIGGITLGLIYY
ncbi:MAG: undecaprenyl-diphosphatase [bacterium]|jgi:undecaprenyl-diphosphatase